MAFGLCMQNRKEKIVAVVVAVLVVAAIAVPIYISSLKPETPSPPPPPPDVGPQPSTPPSSALAYTSSGALTFENGTLLLNGSRIRIISGAVHYFRTVPGHWRDRLAKLKACGMNTVETWVHLPYINIDKNVYIEYNIRAFWLLYYRSQTWVFK